MPQDEITNLDKLLAEGLLQGELALKGLPRAQRASTLERKAFVEGLLLELREQMLKYLDLTRALATTQARLSIVERNLRLTRDHLQMTLSTTDEEVPENWREVIKRVRFVGARLGDACVTVLSEVGSMTTAQLLTALNSGQFRFRTATPLREINAALLRQPQVDRQGDIWTFKPATESVPQEVSATP